MTKIKRCPSPRCFRFVLPSNNQAFPVSSESFVVVEDELGSSSLIPSTPRAAAESSASSFLALLARSNGVLRTTSSSSSESWTGHASFPSVIDTGLGCGLPRERSGTGRFAASAAARSFPIRSRTSACSIICEKNKQCDCVPQFCGEILRNVHIFLILFSFSKSYFGAQFSVSTFWSRNLGLFGRNPLSGYAKKQQISC